MPFVQSRIQHRREFLLGKISRVLYEHYPDDGTLCMLHNLHATSSRLRKHATLIDVRNELKEARFVFLNMTSSINSMLELHLKTPLNDMTVLDQFMMQDESQECSRLRVLKDLFDRVKFLGYPLNYTPYIVKLMQTAEYVHETCTDRDFSLLSTQMHNLAACLDNLKILFKSVYYVFKCTAFQVFSSGPQNITSKDLIMRRRAEMSDRMLSVGVFDHMLTVCTRYPAQHDLLYQYLDILKLLSPNAQRIFFRRRQNMWVLQELMRNATSDTGHSIYFSGITLCYAELMDIMYYEDEDWRRLASQHDESRVAIVMAEITLVILTKEPESGAAWKLFKIISLYMGSHTILTLYASGWMDRLCVCEFPDKDIRGTLIQRCIAALRNQDTVSEADRLWIQKHSGIDNKS